MQAVSLLDHSRDAGGDVQKVDEYVEVTGGDMRATGWVAFGALSRASILHLKSSTGGDLDRDQYDKLFALWVRIHRNWGNPETFHQ